MTDQEREAEYRTVISGRIRYEGVPEYQDEFLLRLLDKERQRVKKLEDALREGIRVVTMMEKALRSCQEIIEAEDYCECDMCCQLRDTIKGVLNAQAISHDNT